ncbi:MAG: T9SS type A sorting domain-containing protein [candidate division WOR-3 bacterium]
MIRNLITLFFLLGLVFNAQGVEKEKVLHLSSSYSLPISFLTPDEYLLGPNDFSEDEETLHYDAEPDRGVNIRGTYCYAGGVRFTAPESLIILAVLFYLTDPADLAIVYIRDQRTELQPGPIIDSFRTNSGGQYVWKRANLPRPVIVPAGRDFWTTITVWHSANYYPLTLDLGPIVPTRGGFISIPTLETLWHQLTDPPFWTDRNWNIRAVVKWTGGTDIREGIKKGRGQLSFLPNPSRDGIEVNCLAKGEMVELRVYNHFGKLVYSERRKDGCFRLKELPAGVYLFRIKGKDFQEEKKLVIAR